MAVTVISQPTPDTDLLISASYPFEIVLQTDKTAANITQHRFTCAVFNDSAEVGIKYTVISMGTNQGKFDLSQLFRTLFTLSEKQYSNQDDITQSDAAWRLDGPTHLPILLILGEQYYQDGVFYQNSVSTPSYNVVRGYTDRADNAGYITNFLQVNGLSDFLTYSGYMRAGLMMRTWDSLWPDASSVFKVEVSTDGGSGGVAYTLTSSRNNEQYKRAVFVPLYINGYTNQPNMTYVEVTLSIAPPPGTVFTVMEQHRIEKNVFACEDEEILVMFQDRFFQWSFMSFPKKHRITTNTQSQAAELLSGREKYNLKGSDTFALNTDWMREEQNDLVRDLISTEKAYFVDPGDGSLEPVVVVPNSLTYKTSRNNNLIQYSLSFRAAVDNFRP